MAVFIAYNANSGLPFVPTYHLNAELPSGGKLVKGNEVRVGGFRVGVVKEISRRSPTVNGERRAVAVEARASTRSSSRSPRLEARASARARRSA